MEYTEVTKVVVSSYNQPAGVELRFAKDDPRVRIARETGEVAFRDSFVAKIAFEHRLQGGVFRAAFECVDLREYGLPIVDRQAFADVDVTLKFIGWTRHGRPVFSVLN